MTETRIRWSDDPAVCFVACIGSVGTVDPAVFQIFAPDRMAVEWILTTSLPGMEDKRHYGDSADELKAEAERWLEEFTASLGAVFPDCSAVTRFEVIDHTKGLVSRSPDRARAVVAYGVKVALSFQDDGRTLKAFVADPDEACTHEPEGREIALDPAGEETGQ